VFLVRSKWVQSGRGLRQSADLDDQHLNHNIKSIVQDLQDMQNSRTLLSLANHFKKSL
jgi:hypothetical protein